MSGATIAWAVASERQPDWRPACLLLDQAVYIYWRVRRLFTRRGAHQLSSIHRLVGLLTRSNLIPSWSLDFSVVLSLFEATNECWDSYGALITIAVAFSRQAEDTGATTAMRRNGRTAQGDHDGMQEQEHDQDDRDGLQEWEDNLDDRHDPQEWEDDPQEWDMVKDTIVWCS